MIFTTTTAFCSS